MSSKQGKQSRVDEAREQIAALADRAKRSEASTRAKLVDVYHEEEAEWDAFYVQLHKDLDVLAADALRAEAELDAEIDAELEAVGSDVDAALDRIDEELLRLDRAITAKEDQAVAHVKSSFRSLRSKVEDRAA